MYGSGDRHSKCPKQGVRETPGLYVKNLIGQVVVGSSRSTARSCGSFLAGGDFDGARHRHLMSCKQQSAPNGLPPRRRARPMYSVPTTTTSASARSIESRHHG
jgi:hypothetical protein